MYKADLFFKLVFEILYENKRTALPGNIKVLKLKKSLHFRLTKDTYIKIETYRFFLNYLFHAIEGRKKYRRNGQ